MDKNEHISIMNLEGDICENLIDIDYGSFKENYELNESRYINFTAYRTSINRYVFDLIICENFVVYMGEKFTIKEITPKVEGDIVSVDVTAYHCMYEFQNHFVETNKSDDESTEQEVMKYNLKEYLEYGFKNQKAPVKFSYRVYGSFDKKVSIEELGNKNGLEYIKDAVELFGCIIFPNDTEIGFYSEEVFYRSSEEIIRYKYNTDTVTATVSTLELRTAIKVFGKKYTSSEKNNYNPIKTPQVKYIGTFNKVGTYYTESVGAKAVLEFKCKYGKETIKLTIKKAKQGGLFDIYFDGKKIKRISCYAKSTQSETIELLTNVDKGNHKLDLFFVGEDPSHPMPEPAKPKSEKAKPKPKLKPRMYIGTEKSTVLNVSAKNTGNDNYKAIVDYKSPNIKLYGLRYANTVNAENIDNEADLIKYAKSQITDVPKTELEINYISYEKLGPRDSVFFVHELMGYNTELKVVKLERGHPFTNTIDSVGFSNEIKDMVQIQQALNKRMQAQDNRFDYQANQINKMYISGNSNPFETMTIGSVLI